MAKKKPELPDDEDGGSIRPGDGDILVLLVGINEYANISKLNGCINDLNKIETYLKERFKIEANSGKVSEVTDVQVNGIAVQKTTYLIPEDGYGKLIICRLVDTQATYQGIIDTFRGFFKEATAADRIWFHYSGHGTEAPTAAEFKDLENNKDQGLMCQDCINNKETGEYDKILADKELAVLLHEISEGEGGTPHIVVTIDSCHSGNVTRDPDGPKLRNERVGENAPPRALASYIGNYYEDAPTIKGQPIIPPSTHLVMTACTNLQLAGENEGGGFFTSSLIEVLENVEDGINYADLLVRTRNAVRNLAETHPQTPQFEVVGDLSAYTRFLEGTPQGSPDRYEIRYQDGTWNVGVGAIHGLSTTATTQETATAQNTPIGVHLYDFDEPNVIAAKATITEVGAQFSPIKIEKSLLDTIKDGLSSEIEAGNLEEEEETAQKVAVEAATQRVLDTITKEQVRNISEEVLSKLHKKRLDEITKTILSTVTKNSLLKFLVKGSITRNQLAKMTKQTLAETMATALPQINQSILTDINQSILSGIGQGGLNENKDYFGVLNAFPAEPEYVLVTGLPVDVANFITSSTGHQTFVLKNIHFLAQEDPAIPHSLKVNITEDAIAIEDLQKTTPLEWSRKRSRSFEVLVALSKIVNWRRFIRLNNPNSTLLDKIDFSIGVVGRGRAAVNLTELDNDENMPSRGNIIQASPLGKNIRIIASQANSLRQGEAPSDKKFGWTPTVNISNHNGTLHAYLFKLPANYSISTGAEKRTAGNNLVGFGPFKWGLSGEEKEDTLYCKLLVTSEEVDTHQITQSDINSFRNVEIEDFNPDDTGFKDWCAINIKLHLINEDHLAIGG